MQIKALSLAFAAFMAGAMAAPVESEAAAAKLATRYDCPGHVSVTCLSYGFSACCSWVCDPTGYVILDDCQTGGI
jgi:hypothetical protein